MILVGSQLSNNNKQLRRNLRERSRDHDIKTVKVMVKLSKVG